MTHKLDVAGIALFGFLVVLFLVALVATVQTKRRRKARLLKKSAEKQL